MLVTPRSSLIREECTSVSIGITYSKVYLYNVCVNIVAVNIVCHILCIKVTNQLQVTGVIAFK